MVTIHSWDATDMVVGQRYRLLHPIGEHEFSQTWEAFDARLERRVALRLLSESSPRIGDARARLRQAAREPIVETGSRASRVLDGGDDPTFGLYIVAELSSALEATRPLDVLHSSPSADGPAQPRQRLAPRPARTSGLGAPALVSLVVFVVAVLAFLNHSLGLPEQQPLGAAVVRPTPRQPTRPVSGAAPDQPAPGPTVALPQVASRPTAAPTEQPALEPASAPTAPAAPAANQQLTREPTSASPAEGPIVQPTTGLTPRPTVQPALPAASPDGGSPADAIRLHYSLIDAKRYAEGYTLMDAHLRALNSPAQYAGWFANKISIRPVSIDLISQTPTQAVVRCVVQTTDRINGQVGTSEVAEQFVLRYEDDAWRIDQVTRV